MMNQQNVLKASLLLVLVLGLTACGASKQENSVDLASRATDTNTADKTRAWAQCNSGSSIYGTMQVNLAAYYEGGNVRNDLMYARIANLPTDFESGNQYIQMYRWQANTSGSTFTDPTPLSFKIVNPSTGAVILQNKTSVKWLDVKTAAESLGYGDALSFFKNVWIVVDLRDPSASFDVLMTALYKSDNSSRDYANVLLPIFAADPAAYATDLDGTARNPALQALHPFKDKLNQGWTKTDFQTWANNFCTTF